MLRDTLFILRNELKFMLKSRETLMWVFFMPIVFMYFIGTVTGSMGGGGGRQDVLALWSGDNPGFMAEELQLRLEERDYNVVVVDSLHKLEEYSRRLTIPADFTNKVMSGEVAELQLERKRSGIGGDFDQFRVGRASYTLLADLIVSNSQDVTPSAESFATIRQTPRAVTLQVKPAGERLTIPSGYQQAIPGLMVMFTLMVMTTSGAVQLVVERKQGLLRRLAYTPMTRLSIILGKWGGKLSLGLVQVSFAMLVGTVLYKMDWGPNLGMVIVVMVAYAAAMASVGMLLGTLATSAGMAVGIGVISSNVLAALGGCWWPIEITPEWMQKLQLFVPTGWAMDALHRLISFADTPASVLPHLAIMLLVATAALGISARAFRFE
jgi:ABC-2 type transport system permease protein